MNLAVFDIDGTLTESVAVDEACFIQAFRDVLSIGRINTNWLDYHFQTDSGLALEICRQHLGRDPGGAEVTRLQSRFAELLGAAVAGTGQPIREVPGAAALLRRLAAHPRWHVAIATGGWGCRPGSNSPRRGCRWTPSPGRVPTTPWTGWTSCGRPSGGPGTVTAGTPAGRW